MAMALGYGEHFYQVLKYFHVENIALIIQEGDEMSMSYGVDIRGSFIKHGITIVQTVSLPYGYSKDMLTSACDTLKRSNVRYFIISTQAYMTSSIYTDFGLCGLVGPEYVWLGVQNIFSDKTAYLDLGYIQFNTPLSLAATNLSFYQQIYPQIDSIHLNGMSISSIISNLQNNFGNFDCIMTMLLGFDKLVKSNLEYTAEKLAAGQLRDKTNYTLFQSVNIQD
ncbi:hypothetical protein BCR33DRAFT_534876 [Rhizoclosmatium globosum]|uniref:Receptor ligand binding region domain-containing protein n=1 Tax=Rhizoclosmatium globosum TaxID=329046 RepID=A0A1Y2BC62_9FUNG|nr:hypothetical protein BCR33DRAFT_534876 [Rhizoclosmatium globosum]|eukprot:ORY32413.1 hypothetical protein BCR33DRAFT_534876 [Rhizoclosmatium globosum]